jgi:hypothetical protein
VQKIMRAGRLKRIAYSRCIFRLQRALTTRVLLARYEIDAKSRRQWRSMSTAARLSRLNGRGRERGSTANTPSPPYSNRHCDCPTLAQLACNSPVNRLGATMTQNGAMRCMNLPQVAIRGCWWGRRTRCFPPRSRWSGLRRLRAQGPSLPFAERAAELELEVADRAHILQTGRTVLQGSMAVLAKAVEIQRVQLGAETGAAG